MSPAPACMPSAKSHKLFGVVFAGDDFADPFGGHLVDALGLAELDPEAPPPPSPIDSAASTGDEEPPSVAGAEAELARSVATPARRETASADPGEAKALLEAAREAAEAPSALRA